MYVRAGVCVWGGGGVCERGCERERERERVRVCTCAQVCVYMRLH